MMRCPSCGYEAPDDSAFCSKCGTKLVAPQAIPEERKVVTTLICDIVGFTAMSEQVDAEDVDRLLGEYAARATKVIESHGGTVEKFIGDAVVGVFGVPATHEDDPERAVRAGLRLLESLEGLTRPDGSPLQARIGVNTGEALVRLDVDPASGRGFLTGDAVNVAARLQAAAPPSGVAVGTLTHELTARVIVYEELPPMAAKGKAEPVPVWRAVAPVARTGTQASGWETPFVGRQVELGYLTGLLDKAADSSSPQIALIVGEPGIGKSRLVAEFSRRVDESPRLLTWRQGHCLPFGEGVTFWAPAEILKAHAGILDTDDRATVESKLEAVLPEGEDRPWFRQRLRALLGLEAAKAERQENFTAWLRFFEGLAAQGLAVLVLEDLHWADEALLDFLEFLGLHVARVPLMVVATARPELFERHPSFAGAARVNRIALEPLSQDEAQELVGSVLGATAADLSASIARRTRGNPFYAVESARLAGERIGDSAAKRLASSVQAVIAARLDGLAPEAKGMLSDAAVIGDVFWAGALAEIGGRGSDDTAAALGELTAKQLIYRALGSSMAGEREYAFGHALAREVAYGQLPRAERARKHAAVAGWLEKKAGDRGDDLGEILAHHYLTALELARACGEAEMAERLVEPAVRQAVAAGERAMRLDVGMARRYLERGLAAGGDTGPLRARLLLELGEATAHQGDLPGALELANQAADGYRHAGEVIGEARAKQFVSQLLTWMCRPEADPLADEAVRLLGSVAPSPVTLEVLTWKAYLDWLRDRRPEQLLADVERVIALAHELGEPEPVMALGRACTARLAMGDLTAVRDHERVVETALARGLGDETATLMFNHAILVEATEGPDACRRACARTIDFASSKGLEDSAIPTQSVLCEALWLGGEWHEALDVARGVTPTLEAAGDVFDVAQVRLGSVFILLPQGDIPAARAELEWAEAKDIASTSFAPYMAAGWAALHFARGERREGQRRLSEWVDCRGSEFDAVEAVFAVMGLRMALTLPDMELAERIAEIGRGPLPFHDLACGSTDALLTEARGEHEAAASAFADAAAGWHDFGVPYEEAQALLGQGRCLLALSRASEAAQPLHDARAVFERLGARPAAAEVDGLLEQLAASMG